MPSVLSHSVQTTRLNVNLAWKRKSVLGIRCPKNA